MDRHFAMMIVSVILLKPFMCEAMDFLVEEKSNCPIKCECTKTASSNSMGIHQTISVNCRSGGLNDSDFLDILQSISGNVESLVISAPKSRPNAFQWNDNINRFEGLKQLSLINCGIPAISQSARLPNLRHLNLKINRIDHLKIRSFEGMPKLEALDLSYNQINVLPSGVFIYLKKLKALSLKNNRLTGLSASLLRGPRDLEELELDGNKLDSTQLNELFSDIPNLVRLEINNCGLSDAEVEHLNLIKVNKLTKLGIGGNNLTQVPSVSLRALEFLQSVDLSENLIRSIGPCSFCGCNISKVNLKGNLMGLNAPNSINREAFAETKIIELNLSFNHFNKHGFNSEMLRDAQKFLRILHLSGNGLVIIEDQLINTLPQLIHLHLGENNIKSVPYDLGGQYSNLVLLNLSGNALETLPPNLDNLMPHLNVLDLSYNRFSTFSNILMTDFIKRLTELYIHHNPWDCECTVQPLQALMLQRSELRQKLLYDETICAKPPSFAGHPLYHVKAMNECSNIFGSDYDLGQVAQIVLILALLLVLVFLIMCVIVLVLYCGRNNSQKGTYITGEDSHSRLTAPSILEASQLLKSNQLDVTSSGGSSGTTCLTSESGNNGGTCLHNPLLDYNQNQNSMSILTARPLINSITNSGQKSTTTFVNF